MINPFKWIYRFYNYLMTWQMHRDTIKHLNRLSNRELNDIGLTRGDIDNLVWMREDFISESNSFDYIMKLIDKEFRD
mgnify:CR=1 FL=1